MGIKGKGRKQPVQAMSIASTGLIKINGFFFFFYFFYNSIIFFYKKRKIKKKRKCLQINKGRGGNLESNF